MGTLNLSPEERKRRSDAAKALVAAGKIGGPRPGSGRPRKKRASELVAEAAESEAKTMIDTLRQTMAPGNPANVRQNAVKLWLDIEQKEESLRREEDSWSALSMEQLLEAAAEKLARLHGSIPGTYEDMDDVELVPGDGDTS
jgi:hypothetical protein